MEQPHPTETQPNTPPRIYVASLADYNAGRLIGTWIDATQDPDDINNQVQRMLTTSNEPIAEEWAIHDYEGFHHTRISEYSDFETVSRIAQGIEDHGDAFSAWIVYNDDTTNDVSDQFQEAYLGRFDSIEAYATQHAEDIGLTNELVPDWARPYLRIDIDALARDLEIELHTTDATGGGIHVFNPNI